MARPRMRDNLSFSVPEHIRKKIEAMAEQEDCSMSEVARAVLYTGLRVKEAESKV